MRYGSVCSGIEAATAAWHPLGWEPAFFSEIEAFPRAVLDHHYPDVPLHGDFTTIGADDYGPIELLVGGTPCQSFSIAGLRKGLDDDRGNLALEYLRLAQRTRPKWLVWENVPGVLSSNEGRDFGAFLGGLVELGYGYAYRTLDAQYFGVPQRRRRVFVVGYLGDWRPPAAVLFERHSLCGHPAPSRKKGETAPTIPSRSTAGGGLGTDFDCDGGLRVAAHRMRGFGDYETDECASALKSRDAKDATDLICVHGTQDPDISIETAHPLGRNNGGENAIAFNPGQSSKARSMGESVEVSPTLGTKLDTAVAFKPSHYTRGKDGAPSEVVPPLTADADKGDQDPVIAQPYSIMPMNSGKDYKARETDVAQPLMAGGPVGGNQGGDYIAHPMAVRRLTPIECERLQGFPDNFTSIPWRNKPAEQCPDGPRYKALGNSMAVPVMHWIGQRIALVKDLMAQEKAIEIVHGLNA